MSKRFLVIQTAFLGDAILTLPMIQKLKENKNDFLIDVLCAPGAEEIFSASPYVSSVIVYDKKGKQKSIWQLIKLSSYIKKQNYSSIYSPHRSFRSALIVFLSGVKESYGFTNSSFRKAYGKLVTYKTEYHEVRRNLELIGIKTEKDNWKILPDIKTDEKTIEKVKSYLTKNNINEFVVVAPGSVWETKKYPTEYYKNLISYLIHKDLQVVIIGGKDDIIYCKEMAAGFDKVFSTAGDFSIKESIELLKNARLLICNDSAPTHLGMCADIPVITIYCSTIKEFGFYPYNNCSSIISYNDLDCKPCGIHGHHECPIKTFVCAHNISIGKIKSEIDRVVDVAR